MLYMSISLVRLYDPSLKLIRLCVYCHSECHTITDSDYNVVGQIRLPASTTGTASRLKHTRHDWELCTPFVSPTYMLDRS